MIPYWYYLIGLVPILALDIPNSRKIRLTLAVVGMVGLLFIWSGISKGQAFERDFVRWSIRDLANRTSAWHRASGMLSDAAGAD